MLKITAAIHNYCFFDYSSEGRLFYTLGQYVIFGRLLEDFAFYMMKEACEKRTTNILDISGKKYALDSTTISLCLATFSWAKFRNKKG